MLYGAKVRPPLLVALGLTSMALVTAWTTMPSNAAAPTGRSAAEATNAAVVRDFVAAFNRGDQGAVERAYATGIVFHAPLPAPGLEGVRQLGAMMRTAFRDLQHTLEEVITEGDRVVTRGTLRGTHEGPFLGISPTGRSATFASIEIRRLENGKIVEQ